jgi:hypothetical protein
MWPFSRQSSEDREAREYIASKTDFMEKVTGQIRELDQRMKFIEREHEDLHRHYRKLRGTFANEARQEARAAPAGGRGNGGEDQPGPMTKDELRRRFLTPRGPGKNPESD